MSSGCAILHLPLVSCRWCSPSAVTPIICDRRPYYWLLHAVFLNNCASSMSFSIFTQNDAGQGGGGAVYRYASLLTAAETDHFHITHAAHVRSDHKLKPFALRYRNACRGFTINCSFIENTAAQVAVPKSSLLATA